MRAREFIVEYNQQITFKNFRNKIIDKLKDKVRGDRDARSQGVRQAVSYLPGGENHGYRPELDSPEGQKKIHDGLDSTALSVIKAFEMADPSPNKQYVQWMTRAYVNDTFRYVEDVETEGAQFLEKYYWLAQRRAVPEQWRDVNRIKTTEQFRDAEAAVSQAYHQRVQDDTTKKAVDKGTAKEILNNNEVRIIRPLDEESSKYYGQGTRWCTAADKNCMFIDYADRGPLYIIIPKQPEYDGEKYQIWFDEEGNTGEYQLMDEQDSEKRFEELVERFNTIDEEFWYKLYPALKYNLLIDTPARAKFYGEVAEVMESIVQQFYLEDTEWEWVDNLYKDWRAQIEDADIDRRDAEDLEADGVPPTIEALDAWHDRAEKGDYPEREAYEGFEADLLDFFTEEKVEEMVENNWEIDKTVNYTDKESVEGFIHSYFAAVDIDSQRLGYQFGRAAADEQYDPENQFWLPTNLNRYYHWKEGVHKLNIGVKEDGTYTNETY